MITNYKQRTRKDDVKLLGMLIFAFLVAVWLCTPPGNKFLQVCFWGNNTKMFIAKLQHKDTTEWQFHRNNAIYLAKMYPKESKYAIKEMDKAIAMLPTFAPESDLKMLYNERAQIHMFYGNYKQALSDYVNAGKPGIKDYLRIALLYKMIGNYKHALSYCNAILDVDMTAFSGYACLADIYDTVGRPDVSIRIWDLAIERRKNSPRSYLSRAHLKKKIGDMAGYEKDLATAREYSPNININDSIIEETLHPKVFALSIK